MSATSKPRILVCDDEQQILRALRVILRDAGFEALPANDAEEALDLAAVQHPDAAIIDLVPWPGSDWTSIVPPLASTNPLAIASPSPEPVQCAPAALGPR